MTDQTRDPITIASVEARNFRRLTIAQVEHVPGKGLVRVQGKNGSGKSSFLRAIMGALGGAAEVHESSLQEGAENGEIRVRLSNGFSVERRFTEAAPKGYLTVVGPDGGRHNQGKLTEWLGDTAFDPQAFFALSADRQRDLLFRLGTDADLPGKLAAVRKEHAEVYEQRTPLISERRHLAKVERPAGEKPERVDTSAEMAKLRELQAQERERGDMVRAHRDAEKEAFRDAERAIEDADRDVRGNQRLWEQESERHSRLTDRIEQLRTELARAEAEAEDLGESLVQLDADVEKAKSVRAALPDPYDVVAALPEIDLPPDASKEIAAVQARLEQADETNAALEPWKRWEEAQERMAELKSSEDELTATLDELRAREGQLLDEAGIPVEGLSFDESGSPMLSGRPLEVASGAERVRMAVQVAMAANPDLRIVLLDEEANSLDADGLAALDQLARDHGFQVWAARVVEDPGSEVVIEDGEARGREASDPDSLALVEG